MNSNVRRHSVQRDAISPAFYLTFAVAAVIELVSLACVWLGWYSAPSAATDAIWWLTRYGPVTALGFMVGRISQPYRTAFANVWPFAILWFVVGIITLRMSEMPPDWDAEKLRSAQWGYVLASVLVLPLAFASAALGVCLARRFHRVPPGDSNAA